MPASTIEDAIRDNAAGPKKAQGDAGSVEQHSIPEQIEADRYFASKEASKQGLGIRMTKVVPPGAI